jgi:hypothetical protein
MGSAFARVNVSGALKKLQGLEKIIQEEAINMSREIAEFGELEMKSNILASGTPFSQKARQAGVNKGPGRYRTGAMYNAVSSRVEAGPKQVRAAFGWIKNLEQYFLFQERGFRNKFAANYGPGGALLTSGGQPSVKPAKFPRTTRGMFALRDARQTVVNELPRFTRKYEGIIARRAKAAGK